MDNAKPSDPIAPTYRAIGLLCKSNAGCSNLLSQLAGLLRISTAATRQDPPPRGSCRRCCCCCCCGVFSCFNQRLVVVVVVIVVIVPSPLADLCCDQRLGLAESHSEREKEREGLQSQARAGESHSWQHVRPRSAMLLGCVVVLSPDLVELCL